MLVGIKPPRIARLCIDRIGGNAHLTIETRNPAIVDAIADAFEHTAFEPYCGTFATWYSVRFEDARGRLRTAVTVDASGSYGTIDGRLVRFSTPALVDALISAFAVLA